MSKFIKGTIILMAAGLITRLLGFINRIVIARMIGEEGVGLFMMAFPTLILVITIVQLGLPVAISKAVAEAEARKDSKKTKKILAVSLAVTGALSLIFTPALIWAAPFLSTTLFTDQRIYYPLVAIAPIIPIVAISSVIRGYFQGKQNMKPAAISQVLEQTVRIALIAIFAKQFIHLGIEYAAAAAMVASVLGEMASLIYLFTVFKMKKRFPIRRQFIQTVKRGKETLQELFRVALPATGSRMIGSLSWFFEPIVVSHSLVLAGFVAEVATRQYGLLTGYALPLLTLPSFITFSLATALVPAISEANAVKNYRLVEARLQKALHFCLISGGLAIVIMYVYSEPLMNLMYGSTNGSHFIKLMAPFFILHFYQGPLLAILQALDLARAAMINSLIGNIMKIGVIFVLASQPAFGINGVALGIGCGTVLITLLHYATVLKRIQFTIYIMNYVKFAIIALATGWLGTLFFQKILQESMSILSLLLGILVTCLIYMVLLFSFKLLKKDDIKQIPFFNKWIFK